MSEKQIEMINKFGNKFTCPESEVERWMKAGARRIVEAKNVKTTKTK